MYLNRFRKIGIILIMVVFSMVIVGSEGDKYDLVVNKKYNVTGKFINELWQKMLDKSNQLNKGFDMTVEVNAGVDREEAGDEWETVGEVVLKVPIYSKEARDEKRIRRKEFLDYGAELLQELEVNAEKVRIYKEKENIMKTIMMEEGIKSIESYHTAKEKRKEIEANIDEIMRKIDIMLM